MEDESYALAVGDVHGNWLALQAAITDAEQLDVSIAERICTGDVCGHLGSNDECIDFIRQTFDYAVFGNHDARVRPDFPYAPPRTAEQIEHKHVTEQCDENHIEWLTSLPETVHTDDYKIGHARPVYIRDPGYPCHGFARGDTGVQPTDVTQYGPYIDGAVGLTGHTHIQHSVNLDKFEGQSGLLVNPGSVGVPWDAPAEYALVNPETGDVIERAVPYDYDALRDELEAEPTLDASYFID